MNQPSELKIKSIEKFITFPEDFKVKARDASKLIEQARGIEGLAYANHLFLQIDPAFLSMKHKKQFRRALYDYGRNQRNINFKISLPIFGIYTLESPLSQLELTLGVYYVHYPREMRVAIADIKSGIDLPEILFDNWTNPIRNSTESSSSTIWNESYRLTALFEGLIPKRIKEKIESYRRIFGRDIYIVAEADNWEGKAIPVEDPLVIGIIHDKCYLIDQFNCTPAEHYVKSEFAT